MQAGSCVINDMKQEIKIIFLFTILFVLSSGWLFYSNERHLDPNYRKNWWAVYFQKPKSDSLNFTIENHSDKSDFHWEVAAESGILQKADFKISKGEAKGFLVNIPRQQEKITINVSDGSENKEIYKNFNSPADPN